MIHFQMINCEVAKINVVFTFISIFLKLFLNHDNNLFIFVVENKYSFSNVMNFVYRLDFVIIFIFKIYVDDKCQLKIIDVDNTIL